MWRGKHNQEVILSKWLHYERRYSLIRHRHIGLTAFIEQQHKYINIIIIEQHDREFNNRGDTVCIIFVLLYMEVEQSDTRLYI